MPSPGNISASTSVPLHQLVPDDSDVDVLPSFPDIKRKTTEVLYTIGGNGQDKSPKGSVDHPIQELVDLINAHPSFSTLSSCSGRIALFDPGGASNGKAVAGKWDETLVDVEVEENNDNHNNHDDEYLDGGMGKVQKSTAESGKGRGGWLLVSHDEIDATQLLSIFNEHATANHDAPTTTTTALLFKFEPMLLHVAAATMDRARQLLTLALQLGFRESGLIVPGSRAHRVTVAIRGYGLSLTVPLARHGPLRPSDDYLQALMGEANQRLRSNQTKIQRLQDAIQKQLFRIKPSSTSPRLEIKQGDCIPDLNLWGHAAVAIPCDQDDVDALVFGGYGRGPDYRDDTDSDCGAAKRTQRSREILRLKRRSGTWGSRWESLPQKEHFLVQNVSRLDSLGVDAKHVCFTPREGAAAICLPRISGVDANQRIILIWGGRQAPSRPLGDLFLFEYPSGSFLCPVDVRGELPAPRWGHSLTALSNDSNAQGDHRKHLAVLIGGRDERSTPNSMHLLSLIKGNDNESPSHFLWETICIESNGMSPPILPFHHCAALITMNETETIFVFGGLTDPTNILQSFTGPPMDSKLLEIPSVAVVAYKLSLTLAKKPLVIPSPVEVPGGYEIGFGSAVCNLEGLQGMFISESEHFLLLSGGVLAMRHEEWPSDIGQSMLSLVSLSRSNPLHETKDGAFRCHWRLRHHRMSCDLDPSVMVHHRSLSLAHAHSDCQEVLLIGGGVMGFAFGPCFSRSYHVKIRWNNDDEPPENSEPYVPSSTHSATGEASEHAASDAETTALSSKSPVPAASDLPAVTNVAFVNKQNAKTLKTTLENFGFLDKSFRMTNANETTATSGRDIAVPITKSCLALLQNSGVERSLHPWISLVEGIGTQQMPYSTARFAARAKK